MSTETLTILQKRQAIERGLSQYLQGTLFEQILNHWEAKYGDQPSFVLNRFLSEICTTEELRYFEKTYKMSWQRWPKVEKQVLLNPSAKASKSEQGESVTRCIDVFVCKISVKQSKPLMCRSLSVVKTQLEALSIVVDKYQALNDRAVLEALPMTQYAQVLTVCYENYCEFYGPAKSRSTLCPCEAPNLFRKSVTQWSYASLNLNKIRHKKRPSGRSFHFGLRLQFLLGLHAKKAF